jgi:CBS domain-containing protein/sporulation protein YlmC with PRC-barrel domain
MTSQVTFYLSLIIGKRFYSPDGKSLGKVKDLAIEFSQERPYIFAARCKVGRKIRILDFRRFQVVKAEERFIIRCDEMIDIAVEDNPKILFLAENVFDKQIVDINGRKLVRVNDIRIVFVPSGAYVIAVDVGIDGLLRRLGFSSTIRHWLSLMNLAIPTRYIRWDEIEAFDFAGTDIKLSTSYSKLHTLHPSDLADIIEDMDKTARTNVFSSLDEEKAADVLEEMESKAQVHIVESLPKEKAADVLEKMPAHEVADIMEELSPAKAEELLKEMENESSQDVRKLLAYEEKQVGSFMSSDYIAFNKNMTAGDAIDELRKRKPEQEELYTILVVDNFERLVATVTLRDLVIADPLTPLHQIMNIQLITVFDDDNVKSLAEIISKYNLLAIPVINDSSRIQGVVIIDDVVEELVENE